MKTHQSCTKAFPSKVLFLNLAQVYGSIIHIYTHTVPCMYMYIYILLPHNEYLTILIISKYFIWTLTMTALVPSCVNSKSNIYT